MPGLAPRPDERWPRLRPLPEEELASPGAATALRLVRYVLARIFHDPTAMILASSFFLLMLWGYHGGLELLGFVTDSWKGPGSWKPDRPRILTGIPWDQEAVSFAAGFLLVVVVPIVIIKVVFKQPLSNYGLGFPRDRWKAILASTAMLVAMAVAALYFSRGDQAMRATYPLFRDLAYLRDPLNFALYEAFYLLFFVAIEFVFRGYLLFGLYQVRDQDAPPGVAGLPGRLVFGYYAILISMLSYTAWHLGKPTIELYGTLAWGIAAGAACLTSRTIWPTVLVHWLMNVAMDWSFVRQAA
jgi:hypothetical protein